MVALSGSEDSIENKSHKILRPRYALIGAGVIVIALVVLLVIPSSRYSILGSFMTRHYSVQILSSADHSPVVGAKVTIGSKTNYSGKTGRVSFQVPVGHTHITISKQYFAGISKSILVSIGGSSTSKFVLRVTGIIVPIEITNRIGGSPIRSAVISASKSSATSSQTGRAQLLLPASNAQETATISASGFLSSKVSVSVTSKLSLANLFSLVPVGNVYYLSDSTGSVNVMSSNLDGSGPNVILAGTGKESPNQSQLAVSIDSRYLALLANRDGSQTHLYVFSPQNPIPEEVNPKATGYQFIGWTANDNLIFEIFNSSLQEWQSGTTDLMSFNPATSVSTILFSTQAVGTSANNFANQYLGNVILLPDNKIIYSVNWNSFSYTETPGSFNASLDLVSFDGSGSQTLYSAPNQSYISPSYLVASGSVIFTVSGGSSMNYFVYENGQVIPTSNQTYSSEINSASNYSGFLVAPDGTSIIWSEIINGHNAIFESDLSGANKVQLATLDNNYSIYGLSSNPSYLIIAKDQNELLSMATSEDQSQASLVQIGSYLSSSGYGQYGPYPSANQ